MAVATTHFVKEDLPGFPDSVLSRAIAVAVAWLIIEVELVTLAMGGVSDYGFGRLLGVNAMALGATWLTFRRRAAPSVWLMGLAHLGYMLAIGLVGAVGSSRILVQGP